MSSEKHPKSLSVLEQNSRFFLKDYLKEKIPVWQNQIKYTKRDVQSATFTFHAGTMGLDNFGLLMTEGDKIIMHFEEKIKLAEQTIELIEKEE